MHNLGTVIQFEVTRTLKKKTFWILALSFPLIAGVIFTIIFFSNKTTQEAAKNNEKQKFSIVIDDQSGFIDKNIASSLGAELINDRQAGIDKVKSGQADTFFYYPKNLDQNSVEVYGKDVGLFNNGRYNAVATTLLEQSVSQTVSKDVEAVLSGNISYSQEYYKDGQKYDGYLQLIAPGVFLVLFYMLIVMFGGTMLTSTTEEKENRVIEMILTTIEARTLVVGKIVSLIILAIIQALVIVVPILIAYLLMHDNLSLPNIDLSNIPVDPVRTVISFLIFASSFMLFTGLLVTIGAATPTAKEASNFFGVVMVLLFAPLYAATVFISSPNSLLVQVLSYFPFTSPIPLMLRNAVGNLTIIEAIISIIILIVTSAFIVRIAVRVFRYGALEYSRRLGIKEIFKG